MTMTMESLINMALSEVLNNSVRQGNSKGDNFHAVAELHANGQRDVTIAKTLGISRERVRQLRVAHGLEARPRWFGEKRICKVCGLSFEARGVAHSEQRCVLHSLVEKPCIDCGKPFRGRFQSKVCLYCRKKQYQQKRRDEAKEKEQKIQWLKAENLT